VIVDLNVYLGRWPFASLGYEKVEDILRLLDRAGIDRAAISSLDSVFYYDCEVGNREVGKACIRYPDRLIPFVAINPNLLSWKEHLLECVETYGARGIRLHPDYHKYGLATGPRAGDDIPSLMEQARTLGLPIHVQTSMFDMRHHPGYCVVWEAPMSDIGQAVEKYPENFFVVGGGRWFGSRVRELLKLVGRDGPRNFAFATDGIGGTWEGVTGLVDQVGSTRIFFSSRTPILYSEASKEMVEQSEITSTDRANILGGNAARLLKLAEG
jgi:predicted TIM-barrel fold metal-dependent hydrolase